ncbi:hypothetical protein B9K09_19215 [Pseudomonas sp. M30-35]|nr:hypothetical protein B9K09_19215 [Pseudomonas sp. M30-35]
MQALMGPVKAAVSLAGGLLSNSLVGDKIDALKEYAAVGTTAGLISEERTEVQEEHDYAKQEYADGNKNFDDGDIYVLASKFLINLAIGGGGLLAGKAVLKGAKGKGSQAPYNSQTSRNELESTYGRDNVVSTTVPPVDGRNVHLAGQRHPVTGVVFDNKGFPIFDDVTAFDTRISIDTFKSASYEGQMKLATKDLSGAIQQGQVRASSFTAKQLQQISAGAKKIDGYTWHHHQDSGRMQLVPELLHKKTGHIGGEAMGGGM